MQMMLLGAYILKHLNVCIIKRKRLNYNADPSKCSFVFAFNNVQNSWQRSEGKKGEKIIQMRLK